MSFLIATNKSDTSESEKDVLLAHNPTGLIISNVEFVIPTEHPFVFVVVVTDRAFLIKRTTRQTAGHLICCSPVPEGPPSMHTVRLI